MCPMPPESIGIYQKIAFFPLLFQKRDKITRYSQKKSYGHQLGPMTHFLMNQKFDPILYLRSSRLVTHLQSFLCVP